MQLTGGYLGASVAATPFQTGAEPIPNLYAPQGESAAEREAQMQALARNTSIDLFAKIPHGSGQTYIREILLVVDHGSYHVGQLVALRKALAAW